MFVEGGRHNMELLIQEANRVRGRIYGGDSSWSAPRLDGRLLMRPLGGLAGTALDPSPEITGFGSASGDYFGGDRLTFGTEFDWDLPDDGGGGGEFPFNNSNFWLGGYVGAAAVNVLTDLELERNGLVADWKTIICQAILAQGQIVIPTRRACT